MVPSLLGLQGLPSNFLQIQWVLDLAHCAWHVPLIFSFESLGFDSKACVILCALVLQEIVIAHTRT